MYVPTAVYVLLGLTEYEVFPSPNVHVYVLTPIVWLVNAIVSGIAPVAGSGVVENDGTGDVTEGTVNVPLVPKGVTATQPCASITCKL